MGINPTEAKESSHLDDRLTWGFAINLGLLYLVLVADALLTVTPLVETAYRNIGQSALTIFGLVALILLVATLWLLARTIVFLVGLMRSKYTE